MFRKMTVIVDVLPVQLLLDCGRPVSLGPAKLDLSQVLLLPDPVA
jgi:hypothetical protein